MADEYPLCETPEQGIQPCTFILFSLSASIIRITLPETPRIPSFLNSIQALVALSLVVPISTAGSVFVSGRLQVSE